MALATFYRTSRKLIHWGSVFHFGIRINIFKLIYVWKVLCYNMCCTNVTSFSQKSGLGEVVSLSRYATILIVVRLCIFSTNYLSWDSSIL